MRKTTVTADGRTFRINGQRTNAGIVWDGIPVEGLLLNARMVQGVFDDRNPETAKKWAYPDTGVWDPDRNVREFLSAMPEWHAYGLQAFTLNLQGGSPEGYTCDPEIHNTAFLPDGSLDPEYMDRLERILDRADTLGMVVILGYFYFGQAGRLQGEEAVVRAITNATNWLLERAYGNVIVEVNNECDIDTVLKPGSRIGYPQAMLRREGVHGAIRLVKDLCPDGRTLLAGTSFIGGSLPTPEAVAASDVILLHGNKVETNEEISAMVAAVERMDTYRGQPIVFNEDDHYDFDRADNHLKRALAAGASWGYYDNGENDYRDGFQAVPVRWGISTDRKRAFFETVRAITGAKQEKQGERT